MSTVKSAAPNARAAFPFLDDAAAAIVDEASARTGDAVGIEQLLLALADSPDEIAPRALAAVGVTADDVRKLADQPRRTAEGFTDAVIQALDEAHAQASFFKYDVVTPVLLLLGIA